MMIKTAERLFAIFALASFLFFGVLAMKWYLVDDVQYVVTGQTVTNKTVFHPGEVMEITRHYCVSTNAPGTVQKFLVDHVVYVISDTTLVNRDSGCHTKTFQLEIPKIPAGKYIYRVTVNYQLNPLVSKLITVDDVEITIE